MDDIRNIDDNNNPKEKDEAIEGLEKLVRHNAKITYMTCKGKCAHSGKHIVDFGERNHYYQMDEMKETEACLKFRASSADNKDYLTMMPSKTATKIIYELIKDDEFNTQLEQSRTLDNDKQITANYQIKDFGSNAKHNIVVFDRSNCNPTNTNMDVGQIYLKKNGTVFTMFSTDQQMPYWKPSYSKSGTKKCEDHLVDITSEEDCKAAGNKMNLNNWKFDKTNNDSKCYDEDDKNAICRRTININ